MTPHEKLKEVNAGILRILTLIPKYSNTGWHDALTDIYEGVKRFLDLQKHNDSLAEEFSQPGTLKNYLLKRGFMPHDEVDAEAILDRIIRENENRP